MIFSIILFLGIVNLTIPVLLYMIGKWTPNDIIGTFVLPSTFLFVLSLVVLLIMNKITGYTLGEALMLILSQSFSISITSLYLWRIICLDRKMQEINH
jgi:hypothetical protein